MEGVSFGCSCAWRYVFVCLCVCLFVLVKGALFCGEGRRKWDLALLWRSLLLLADGCEEGAIGLGSRLVCSALDERMDGTKDCAELLDCGDYCSTWHSWLGRHWAENQRLEKLLLGSPTTVVVLVIRCLVDA